jgi:single-strand DNA-binding protein
MSSVNKVILIGNLGKDAEMRFTSGGTPVANFSMATTEKFADRDGQKKEQTEWHRVTVWGKTAEAIHEYLTKGKQVYVEGQLKTREWTDKDGKTQKTTEINAQKIVLLGGGSRAESGGGNDSRSERRPAASQTRGGNDSAPPDDDNIPF